MQRLRGVFSSAASRLWRAPPQPPKRATQSVAVTPPSPAHEKTVERLFGPQPPDAEARHLVSCSAGSGSLIPARSERGNRTHGCSGPRDSRWSYRSPRSTRSCWWPSKAHCPRRNRLSPHWSGCRTCWRGNPKRGCPSLIPARSERGNRSHGSSCSRGTRWNC